MNGLDPTIHQRKDDHILLSLENNGYSNETTWLDLVKLIHDPLPLFDFSEIDTSTHFLNKKICSPILIDALTGGTDLSYKINHTLSKLAEKKNIPIAVGSQRICLTNRDCIESFKIVRKTNPTGVVLGNIGISQVIEMKSFENIDKIISLIDADGICIHLNPLQELIQKKGNLHLTQGIEKLIQLRDYLQIPIILKEVGTGMSKEFILKTYNKGFNLFNISGFGGTNFTLLESDRAKEEHEMITYYSGQTFARWGIPTAASILEAKSVIQNNAFLIASGGIRTGLDIGKCLSLGANLCGLAFPFLKYAQQGENALENFFEKLLYELQILMALSGTKELSEIQNVPKVLLSPLDNWVKQRNLSLK
ncbi:type 2 isopentenyl-diphosphate Delta-isomerase [Candidatus Harpocratesius sp.]